MRFSVEDITKMGLFIAVSVILSRFLSFKMVFMGIEGIRIGFGSFPIILSGIMFGPLGGALVGALADLIGYMLSPLGPYMPHFTFNAALVGFIPGLFLYKRYKKGFEISFLILLAVIGIEEFITTLVLLPFFLNTLFKIPLKILIPPYIFRAILDTVIFSIVIRELLKRGVIK